MNNLAYLNQKQYAVDFLNRYGSKKTRDNYKSYIKEFFNVADIKQISEYLIKKVDIKMVERYFINLFTTRSLSKSAINLRKIALTKLFKYIISIEEGNVINRNPFDNEIIIDLIKNNTPHDDDEPKGRVLTKEEVNNIFKVTKSKTDKRDYLLFRLMLHTGMRATETGLIKFNDFKQLQDGWYLELRPEITKWRRRRKLYIPNDIIDELQEYYSPFIVGVSDWKIFDITGHRVNEIVKKYIPDISAHALRHTVATRLAKLVNKKDNNFDIFNFLKYMGWKDIKTAQKYVHSEDSLENNAGKLLTW